MAKETGLGWTTYSVDDSAGAPRDIRNDCTSLDISTPREVQDVTGIDKSAMERLLLLADASVSPKGVFNDAANLSHSVFRTVPSTSVLRTNSINVSANTLALELLHTDYKLTRAENGALTWEAPGVLADGTVPTWA